jgi:hypothetical protein
MSPPSRLGHARDAISHETTLRLWVAAGGRCEYQGCNAYLLEDLLTSHALNLAERAHIVGATTAARSPRGSDVLAHDRRNEPENLMLLCGAHHRLVDRLIEQHPVERLRRMKREHEDRIHLLTGLQEDDSTIVIRALGGIRGAPIDVPRSAVLSAVTADRRYPRYPLALAGDDLEIDLRDLPDEGDSSYWTVGHRVIVERLQQLTTTRQPIHHVSVFALTRIPFLVALGYYLDDKIPTTVYGRLRAGTGDRGWGSDPEAEVQEFAFRRIAGPKTGATVSVAVSVTAAIGQEVAQLAPPGATYELLPASGCPGRALLDSAASLDRFADAYHGLLQTIEDRHPHCDVIDIYAAVPAAGAVQLGRGIMRDAQPDLRIHDRARNGAFSEAIVLGDSSGRFYPGDAGTESNSSRRVAIQRRGADINLEEVTNG